MWDNVATKILRMLEYRQPAATATEEVKQDIIRLLRLKNPKIFVTGFDRPNLTFSILRGENKKVFLLESDERCLPRVWSRIGKCAWFVPEDAGRPTIGTR